jgi:hypothetical protein
MPISRAMSASPGRRQRERAERVFERFVSSGDSG